MIWRNRQIHIEDVPNAGISKCVTKFICPHVTSVRLIDDIDFAQYLIRASLPIGFASQANIAVLRSLVEINFRLIDAFAIVVHFSKAAYLKFMSSSRAF